MIDKMRMCRVKLLQTIVSGNYIDDYSIRKSKGGELLLNTHDTYLCGNEYTVIKVNETVSIIDDNGKEKTLNPFVCVLYEINKVPILFENLSYVVYKSYDMEDVSKVISYGLDNGYEIVEKGITDGEYILEMRKIIKTDSEDCKIKE